MTALAQKLHSVGLQNIAEDIKAYNRANTCASYGLTAYTAMALFLMTSTVSTPLTLTLVGAFTVFARPKERAMVAPFMVSVASRWVFGSSIALAMAAIAAVGLTIRNRGISRVGAGAIGVTVLGVVPLPIAAISIILTGATLIAIFQRRASLAKRVKPLEVFRNNDTELPTTGNNGAVIVGGEREDTALFSKLASCLLVSYKPITDVPYASAFDGGPQLPPGAVERLVAKANDQEDVKSVRESLNTAKKYTLLAICALVTGATIPTFAFVATAAMALAYEQYSVSLGFGSVAALRYTTGLNPTLFLVSTAAASAYTGKGKEALPVIISAVASTLIFNASLGILFGGVALSVPYIAYRITQLEHAERYISAAEALVNAKHPYIEKRGDRYKYVPSQEGPVRRRVPLRMRGIMEDLFKWLFTRRAAPGRVYEL